ncbi:hypothetical protein Tco_1048913, partial [Tanacetum coccineum]
EELLEFTSDIHPIRNAPGSAKAASASIADSRRGRLGYTHRGSINKHQAGDRWGGARSEMVRSRCWKILQGATLELVAGANQGLIEEFTDGGVLTCSTCAPSRAGGAVEIKARRRSRSRSYAQKLAEEKMAPTCKNNHFCWVGDFRQRDGGAVGEQEEKYTQTQYMITEELYPHMLSPRLLSAGGSLSHVLRLAAIEHLNRKSVKQSFGML